MRKFLLGGLFALAMVVIFGVWRTDLEKKEAASRDTIPMRKSLDSLTSSYQTQKDIYGEIPFAQGRILETKRKADSLDKLILKYR